MSNAIPLASMFLFSGVAFGCDLCDQQVRIVKRYEIPGAVSVLHEHLEETGSSPDIASSDSDFEPDLDFETDWEEWDDVGFDEADHGSLHQTVDADFAVDLVHEAIGGPHPDLESAELVYVDHAPPPYVEETIVYESRPSPEAIWVPGYWYYPPVIRRYVWVTGCWRIPPRGMVWRSGRYGLHHGRRFWISGFWTGSGTTLTYAHIAPPPLRVEIVDYDLRPSPSHLWTGGYWHWTDHRYRWTPGRWRIRQPGRIWIPPRYRRTVRGYACVPGYFDRPVHARGVAFRPVVARNPRDLRRVRPNHRYDLGRLASRQIRPTSNRSRSLQRTLRSGRSDRRSVAGIVRSHRQGIGENRPRVVRRRDEVSDERANRVRREVRRPLTRTPVERPSPSRGRVVRRDSTAPRRNESAQVGRPRSAQNLGRPRTPRTTRESNRSVGRSAPRQTSERPRRVRRSPVSSTPQAASLRGGHRLPSPRRPSSPDRRTGLRNQRPSRIDRPRPIRSDRSAERSTMNRTFSSSSSQARLRVDRSRPIRSSNRSAIGGRPRHWTNLRPSAPSRDRTVRRGSNHSSTRRAPSAHSGHPSLRSNRGSAARRRISRSDDIPALRRGSDNSRRSRQDRGRPDRRSRSVSSMTR